MRPCFKALPWLLFQLLCCTSPKSTSGFTHLIGHPRGTSISSSPLVSYTAPIERKLRLTSSNHNRSPLTKPRTLSLLSASSSATASVEDDDKLPSTVTPILLTVLALIVSEGIALSTLPLHLQTMGATPVQVGLSTSAFSVAQMFMCPLIVAFSSRRGRNKTLSICLAGAALSSIVIASSSAIIPIISARFVAGIFAAAIPIAQAGVTDLVPPRQATLALSRVSAASQTGLVIGPIASAIVQGILKRLGIPAQFLVRGVFVSSAAFALFVLFLRGNVSDAAVVDATSSDESKKNSSDSVSEESGSKSVAVASPASAPTTPKFVQPMLRIIALAAGWSLTLCVAIYSLFASRFLGYGQSELSLTYSTGAAAVIGTQIFIVPRLVKLVGEHLSCTLGLSALVVGLAGFPLIRTMPFHAALYLLVRMGQGVTDTSTATLVARASNGKEERANNLGMIQSTRAGARIFTPLLSGSLFMRSCQQTHLKFPSPGSLPFLANAGLALALMPLPLILKRLEKKSADSAIATD